MNTLFYALVAVLLLGAGAYWWFFMKGNGGDKKKVDMAQEAPTQPTDMGGEKTSAEMPAEMPAENEQPAADATQDQNTPSQ